MENILDSFKCFACQNSAIAFTSWPYSGGSCPSCEAIFQIKYTSLEGHNYTVTVNRINPEYAEVSGAKQQNGSTDPIAETDQEGHQAFLDSQQIGTYPGSQLGIPHWHHFRFNGTKYRLSYDLKPNISEWDKHELRETSVDIKSASRIYIQVEENPIQGQWEMITAYVSGSPDLDGGFIDAFYTTEISTRPKEYPPGHEELPTILDTWISKNWPNSYSLLRQNFEDDNQ